MTVSCTYDLHCTCVCTYYLCIQLNQKNIYVFIDIIKNFYHRLHENIIDKYLL